MKLGVAGKCKSRLSSNVGVIAPGCAPPKNVALGYDVGKISAGCLVFIVVWELIGLTMTTKRPYRHTVSRSVGPYIW